MKVNFEHGCLELLRGDICQEKVDAIVNAANAALAGGGGVDGAIHAAAGPTLMEECRLLGGCPTGETVATGAGRLAAKWVFHTVGPIWQGGDSGESKLLASCYQTALALAGQLGAESIAFPSVATGVYRFPLAAAAAIALGVITRHLKTNSPPFRIRMVLFDPTTLAAYQNALGQFLDPGQAIVIN
ncbi:MAG: O-acetyl-ADP-ribose deacetylase [Planctomycetota bacterium]|jgi:O-acetyl-ADP-ribose deacetylase (regulator of RNase III)|nr:O-acetyl-ADP-ribose deacetylase [Planctomycetota bacterium]